MSVSLPREDDSWSGALGRGNPRWEGTVAGAFLERWIAAPSGWKPHFKFWIREASYYSGARASTQDPQLERRQSD